MSKFYKFSTIGHSLSAMYGRSTDMEMEDVIKNLTPQDSIVCLLSHIAQRLSQLEDKLEYRRDLDVLAMERVEKRFNKLRKEHKDCYKTNVENIEKAALELENKHGKEKVTSICKDLRSRKYKQATPVAHLDRDGFIKEVSPHMLKPGYYKAKTPKWFLDHYAMLLLNDFFSDASRLEAKKIGLI